MSLQNKRIFQYCNAYQAIYAYRKIAVYSYYFGFLLFTAITMTKMDRLCL